MKLLVDVEGEDCVLDFERSEPAHYRLQGALSASGDASVAEIAPGIFSVLLGSRSFTVRLARAGDRLEVWIGTQRRLISLADVRDRSTGSRKSEAAGPLEVRAQMPGKIIKVLVALGAPVEAGQGLAVVEAMKMQNELKSPKTGTVTKLEIAEGVTVAAGDRLMVVE